MNRFKTKKPAFLKAFERNHETDSSNLLNESMDDLFPDAMMNEFEDLAVTTDQPEPEPTTMGSITTFPAKTDDDSGTTTQSTSAKSKNGVSDANQEGELKISAHIGEIKKPEIKKPEIKKQGRSTSTGRPERPALRKWASERLDLVKFSKRTEQKKKNDELSMNQTSHGASSHVVRLKVQEDITEKSSCTSEGESDSSQSESNREDDASDSLNSISSERSRTPEMDEQIQASSQLHTEIGKIPEMIHPKGRGLCLDLDHRKRKKGLSILKKRHKKDEKRDNGMLDELEVTIVRIKCGDSDFFAQFRLGIRGESLKEVESDDEKHKSIASSQSENEDDSSLSSRDESNNQIDNVEFRKGSGSIRRSGSSESLESDKQSTGPTRENKAVEKDSGNQVHENNQVADDLHESQLVPILEESKVEDGKEHYNIDRNSEKHNSPNKRKSRRKQVSLDAATGHKHFELPSVDRQGNEDSTELQLSQHTSASASASTSTPRASKHKTSQIDFQSPKGKHTSQILRGSHSEGLTMKNHNSVEMTPRKIRRSTEKNSPQVASPRKSAGKATHSETIRRQSRSKCDAATQENKEKKQRNKTPASPGNQHQSPHKSPGHSQKREKVRKERSNGRSGTVTYDEVTWERSPSQTSSSLSANQGSKKKIHMKDKNSVSVSLSHASSENEQMENTLDKNRTEADGKRGNTNKENFVSDENLAFPVADEPSKAAQDFKDRSEHSNGHSQSAHSQASRRSGAADELVRSHTAAKKIIDAKKKATGAIRKDFDHFDSPDPNTDDHVEIDRADNAEGGSPDAYPKTLGRQLSNKHLPLVRPKLQKSFSEKSMMTETNGMQNFSRDKSKDLRALFLESSQEGPNDVSPTENKNRRDAFSKTMSERNIVSPRLSSRTGGEKLSNNRGKEGRTLLKAKSSHALLESPLRGSLSKRKTKPESSYTDSKNSEIDNKNNNKNSNNKNNNNKNKNNNNKRNENASQKIERAPSPELEVPDDTSGSCSRTPNSPTSKSLMIKTRLSSKLPGLPLSPSRRRKTYAGHKLHEENFPFKSPSKQMSRRTVSSPCSDFAVCSEQKKSLEQFLSSEMASDVRKSFQSSDMDLPFLEATTVVESDHDSTGDDSKGEGGIELQTGNVGVPPKSTGTNVIREEIGSKTISDDLESERSTSVRLLKRDAGLSLSEPNSEEREKVDNFRRGNTDGGMYEVQYPEQTKNEQEVFSQKQKPRLRSSMANHAASETNEFDTVGNVLIEVESYAPRDAADFEDLTIGEKYVRVSEELFNSQNRMKLMEREMIRLEAEVVTLRNRLKELS